MALGLRLPLIALCSAEALYAPAQAQVVRCTDARTGKVVYTDGGCASGTAAREVEPRKTEEEIRQERIQAAEALERKQQRLDAEATAARQQADRDALRPRAAPPPPHYANTQECVRSRRLMQEAADAQAREPLVYNPRLEAAQRQTDLDCLGPEGYAELEKARAQRPQVVVVPLGRPVHTAPPQRPKLTHCLDFTCFVPPANPVMKCTSSGTRASCARPATLRTAVRSSFLSTIVSTTRCTPLSALTESVVSRPRILSRCLSCT